VVQKLWLVRRIAAEVEVEAQEIVEAGVRDRTEAFAAEVEAVKETEEV
jgi:hypothetical protein